MVPEGPKTAGGPPLRVQERVSSWHAGAGAKPERTSAVNVRLNFRAHRTKGHAVLEAALLTPWLIFLFVGAFDMGFYAYALISVENAVRVAAEYTASSTAASTDSNTACTLILKELAVRGKKAQNV